MAYGFSQHPIVEHEAKAKTLEGLWERVDGIEAGRQGLIDALWAKIPAEITEWGLTTTTKQLDVVPVTTELVVVRSVVVYVKTATGAVLYLGDIAFPVPSRFSNWHGLNIMVGQADKRRLVSTKTTALGLILCGELLPQHGHF